MRARSCLTFARDWMTKAVKVRKSTGGPKAHMGLGAHVVEEKLVE